MSSLDKFYQRLHKQLFAQYVLRMVMQNYLPYVVFSLLNIRYVKLVELIIVDKF